MGREVRLVRADWEPHDEPLFDGLQYPEELADWEKHKAKWDEGLVKNYGEGPDWKPKPKDYDDFEDWYGGMPRREQYTDTRPGDELTHIVMYETTTEGTPYSPKFPNTDQGKRDLAQWLVDNKVSSFGSMTATYEQWLATIEQGWAFSMASVGDELMSGVEFNGRDQDQ